jgi:signal transduction histidine kinase
MSQNGPDIIGSIIFVAIAFAAIGVFVLVLLFSYQRKYIRHIRAEGALKLENERNLLNAQIEVREQTLKDTGAELHDNIGQLLLLAKMQLARQNDPQTVNSRELIQNAIEEIRELSHRLNLDWGQDFDLSELVEIELKKLRKSNLLEIDYTPLTQDFLIDHKYKIIILRCLQEALQNILKHASASKIKLELLLENNHLLVTIHDNGIGFNPIFKTQSAGLVNMAARMKSIGGKFEINLAIDGLGTTCKFIVPLEKQEKISVT